MSQNGNVVPLGGHPRARARLSSQESASVLTGCRELALERMASALSGMLDRVEDELFELAEKAIDRDEQNVLLDARSAARAKRTAIETTFRQHFVEFFNRKVRGESTTLTQAGEPGELSLVGHEALEESLAVKAMSSKMTSACEGELFALSQRMGFLMERPEMEDEANPMSPATICAALKDACDQIESDFRVRMALLRQIERHAEAAVQGVYHDLNAHLVARHILPDVRPGLRRNAAAGASAARRASAVAAETKKPVAPGTQDLFGTLAQLLGSASPAGGSGGGGGGGGGGASGGGSGNQHHRIARRSRDRHRRGRRRRWRRNGGLAVHGGAHPHAPRHDAIGGGWERRRGGPRQHPQEPQIGSAGRGAGHRRCDDDRHRGDAVRLRVRRRPHPGQREGPARPVADSHAQGRAAGQELLLYPSRIRRAA